MYNQHTRGMARTRHRSLVERGGTKAFVRDEGLAQSQKKGGGKEQKSQDIQESKKKRFEHIELPAKLLDYFLRSNKSNISHKEFSQNNLAFGAFSCISFVCVAFFLKKNLACGAFFFIRKSCL